MKPVILTALFLTLLGCSSEPQVHEYFVYERNSAQCFKVTETATEMKYYAVSCERIPMGIEIREVDQWEEKGE